MGSTRERRPVRMAGGSSDGKDLTGSPDGTTDNRKPNSIGSGEEVRDRKYVVIICFDAAKCRCELERVLGVRPAGAARVADLSSNLGVCGWSQVVGVAFRGHIDQRFDRQMVGIAKLDRNALSVETAALPVIEGRRHALPCVGRYAVGNPPALVPRCGNQRHDPPGRFRNAPVVRRTLPISPRPIADVSGPPLQKPKRGTPDEGSIAEYPAILVRQPRSGHARSLARLREIRAIRWTR